MMLLFNAYNWLSDIIGGPIISESQLYWTSIEGCQKYWLRNETETLSRLESVETSTRPTTK